MQNTPTAAAVVCTSPNTWPTLSDAVNTQSQLLFFFHQNNDSKKSTKQFLSISLLILGVPNSALVSFMSFHLTLHYHDKQLAPERISS
jgi:hypothetical protein